MLVAARLPGSDGWDNLAELTALAESAGAVVVDRFQQRIRTINPSTDIGKGKADQLAGRVRQHDADVIIFDNDLSPAQIRELETVTQTKVLDRSELILDIFATRAQTKQAKLQVELAQLQYTYPRLTRMWSHLDTVTGAGGGNAAGAVGAIGVRGPGEQQLEIDRRLVSRRITELRRELEGIDLRRLREIKGRKDFFQVCIVGYTNAGKSTLLNALTEAGTFVEDRLFATLDTKTRKWMPARGVEVLLSDTVGFVRNLPHQLVASFKATLEEAVYADLLLHVIDVSSPDVVDQIESVEAVLAEIGCAEKPMLEVFNKADAITDVGPLEMLQTCTGGRDDLGENRLGLNELAGKITQHYRAARSSCGSRRTMQRQDAELPPYPRPDPERAVRRRHGHPRRADGQEPTARAGAPPPREARSRPGLNPCDGRADHATEKIPRAETAKTQRERNRR